METWRLNKLHIFPIIYVLWLITGLWVCFCIAYWQGHVSIYVPFISETGGKLPESGIFTFVLCIAAFLGFFSMVIRYLIIYKLNSQRSKMINILNKIALLVGCLSLCGMIIVGCYPVYSIMKIHLVGAFLSFFSMIFYGFIQMLISLIMQPRIYRSRIFQIRLAICIFALSFLIGMIMSILKGTPLWSSTYGIVDNMATKMPEDQGFALLLTTTICEWMLLYSFLSFILSFVTDFRMFTIDISIRENELSESNLEIAGTSDTQKEQLNGTKKEK